MVKTTRRERRQRAISSGAAEARGVSKVKAKKHTPRTAPSSVSNKHTSKQAPPALVGKDGKQLVKRPAARKQQGGGGGGGGGRTGLKPSPSTGAGGRQNKRPRSRVEEVDEEDEEVDGSALAPVVADELTATIQDYDQFFSRMLDMIPEHLVLPAKEVAESSYASKYMKVRNGPTKTWQ